MTTMCQALEMQWRARSTITAVCSGQPMERRNGFPENQGHKSFTCAQCPNIIDFPAGLLRPSYFMQLPLYNVPASWHGFLSCCYLLKSCLSFKIPSRGKTPDTFPELNQQKFSESSPPSSAGGHGLHCYLLGAD